MVEPGCVQTPILPLTYPQTHSLPHQWRENGWRSFCENSVLARSTQQKHRIVPLRLLLRTGRKSYFLPIPGLMEQRVWPATAWVFLLERECLPVPIPYCLKICLSQAVSCVPTFLNKSQKPSKFISRALGEPEQPREPECHCVHVLLWARGSVV